MNRWRILVSLVAVTGLAVLVWVGLGRRPWSYEEPPPATSAPEEAEYLWRSGPLAARPAFTTEVAPILANYCSACHDAQTASGGVTFTDSSDEAAARKHPQLWDKVARALRSRNMPPAGQAQPTPEEREVLEAWLDGLPMGPEQSGAWVTVRRLNRVEYNNTIRDLIGLDLRPADDFPADDTGCGFDNNAAVLSLPPLLVEKYLTAAQRVVDAAFLSDVTRQRLLHPPADSLVPLSMRQMTYPERDPIRTRLVLSRDDLPPVDPQEDERQRAYALIMAFADRAYRRPATHAEISRLLRFVEEAQRNGEGMEPGLEVAFQAILCSAPFLFRIEAPAGSQAGPRAGRVNDFELATRLSYFLWSSLPDEELFALAARGTLQQGNTLARQVRRMLRDPKSRALAENFAGQWLQTRALKDFVPDPTRFPDFDEALRAAMIQETELFFDTIVREDRSLVDFLDADYTFVNDRLARHYGLSGVHDSAFRKVSLAGTPRGGVWTQASVLAVTANPTRTSPVKRGRWVLDTLLGAAPPAPPPGVPQLSESHDASSTTLRQQLEQHRANPGCAACHASMDPLGLGLEPFDAIGAWRSHDGTLPIDATGVLPDGRSFEGPAGLRALLRERRDVFVRCLAEKLLTYALGREPRRSDRRALSDIVHKVVNNDYRFSALVLALVHSDPFQARGSSGGNR
jgi:hypothetical protein